MSGPDAAELVGTVFHGRKRGRWQPRTQHLGSIVDARGETIDEVLLTWFPAPASFTGEEIVEIACHGGVVVTKRLLDRLLEVGAELAEPGEFSRRAFENGRIDLTQAEAIMDLISAQTELAARAANEQLAGRLGEALEAIRQDLIGLTAHLEAYIDFPEEDIDPDSSEVLENRGKAILQSIEKLLATADQGRILREGLRTVIAGTPNAGKSSLLNLLLGFDRAIVNEQAGTTRDTIEEVINLEGIPIRLIDTAGIRDSSEAIESQGIERSREQISRAELILQVIDGSAPASEADAVEIPEGSRVLRILNKSDLSLHPDWKRIEAISLSCHSENASEEIRRHLHDFLTKKGAVSSASLTAINARHQHCLSRAKKNVERALENLAAGESLEFIALDLRAALDAVGDVIGKTDVEEILGEIFSTFCIGK
jgi:tRNA modification GTPase